MESAAQNAAVPLLSILLAAVVGGPLPPPLPLFPLTNWWNADVSNAPVDPHSAAYISFIGPTRGMHPDFGGDSSDPSAPIYGMPYVVVDGAQPLVPVTFDYDDESDAGAPGRPPGYPIPEEAKTQQKWIEGGLAGNDRNADGEHRMLYELYALRWTGARWEAGSGATFPLDSNARRPEGWTSADAAGLAILPGLVRYDDAFGTAAIRHPFRRPLRATNGYVFPASHNAGTRAGALPMGARLRLRQSVDLSRFAPPLQRIFQAMKTYGLIVADNGSDIYVTGTYDTRWDHAALNPPFASLHANDFEVVQLGWQPVAAGRRRAVRH